MILSLELGKMEILGASHPAVSTSAAINQRLQELSREATADPAQDARQSSTPQVASVAPPEAPKAAPLTTVTPSQPTGESLLEARTPADQRANVPDDSVNTNSLRNLDADDTKYEFPEELPLSFEEIVDMLRQEPESAQKSEMSYADGVSLTDPASASEAVRFNRTA